MQIAVDTRCAISPLVRFKHLPDLLGQMSIFEAIVGRWDASAAREVIAGHDLSGKTALVTGASSGLGIETARAFLLAGASTVLAVRDSAKGERVAQQLRTETNNERVHVLTLNLGSLTSVRQAAEQFRAQWSRLDLLINNAGIMAVPLGYTPDGFERQFGTNYLGHYLLTRLLLPVLRAAAPARVVVLSSSGHRFSDIHFDDINYRTRPYDKWEAYGQSKTACALFTVSLSRHAGSQDIFANAVNPGAIRTGLQQHLSSEDLQAMGWTDAHTGLIRSAGNLLNKVRQLRSGLRSGRLWRELAVCTLKTARRLHHEIPRSPLTALAICRMLWTRNMPRGSGLFHKSGLG